MTNIFINRGDSAIFDIVVKDIQTNLAVDLSGADLRLTVKPNPESDADGAATIGPITGSVLSPTTAGSGRFWIAPSDTGSVFNNYWYDVQANYGAGSVYTTQSGLFTVGFDVTRTVP